MRLLARDYRRLCAEAPRGLWEDWPAIAGLAPGLRDAPPDYNLPAQEGHVDTTAVSAQSYALSQAQGDHTDPSSVRMADASVLGRRRQAGDVWLGLSDSPKSINCFKLFPRGSDLTSEGVTVRVDGRPLPSVCKYDIIAQLEAAPGEHVVEIEGLRRTAWLRVVAFKLPFVDSDFLVKQQLSPRTNKLSFRIEGRLR